MTFEEAVRKSIKAYFSGRDADNFLSEHGDIKYTREYFDEMEEELIGSDEVDEKRSKEEEELLNGDD